MWRNFKLIQNRDVFCDLRFFVAPLFCPDLRAFAWRKISPKFYMWRKNDKYQVCWEQTPRLCHFKFFEERSWYKALKWPQEVYGGVSLTLWDTCKRLWLWEGTPSRLHSKFPPQEGFISRLCEMVFTCIWWREVQVVLWLWEGTPQQAAYNGQWSIAMHQEGGGSCYYCLLLSKGLKFSSAQCINSTEGG